MPLTPGTHFGSHEITGPLGAGGMGEVYRAHDTELERDVAIKVLPASFTSDAARVARFEQEAKTLAALNHPNIAQVYGIERAQITHEHSAATDASAEAPAGESSTRTAIVMELVEGPTLAERIAQGPIPVDEALRLAMQIADALEAAHSRGIVHRDLKPANIKITPEGVVKVLDFGIAKAVAPELVGSGTPSPIMTTPVTQIGVMLGTAAYMSPEQARGKAIDKRTDIWAFGCVLYEMLTGQLAFGGEDVATTLARVIANPADIESLPATLPPNIRQTLQLCLEKDVGRRIRDIGDVKLALEGRFGTGTDARAEPGDRSVQPRWRGALPLAAGLIVGGLVVGIALWAARSPPEAPVVSSHYALQLPEHTELPSRAALPQAAVSPDGRYMVFAAADPETRQNSLWVRATNSLTSQHLDRTEGAELPFWSPDSQQVGYFANDKLMRVSVAAGAPLTVCNAPNGQGGTWFQTPDGNNVIVFGATNGPLNRVPATGGVPQPVTSLSVNEYSHVYPQALPDGRILYTASGIGTAATYVQSLGSSDRTQITPLATRAMYVSPGFLLYVREGVLLAQAFDLDSLELQGEAAALAEDVRDNVANASTAFYASANAIVYRRGSGQLGQLLRVRWYGRDGTPGDVILSAGNYRHVELSPDNRYLAVSDTDASGTDLWIKDLASGTYQRLASPGNESQEVWAPDSRRLAYSNGNELFYTELGSGRRTPVPQTEGLVLLHSWTPDGKYLLAQSLRDLAVKLVPAPGLDAADTAAAEPQREVFSETYATDHFRVSPDGQWVAYTSQESGAPEIMVARFPSFTDRRQVSVSGGTQPQWRADGRELFFHANELHMMAAEITPGESLEIGAVRELFATNPTVHSPTVFMFAATRDGQRFIMTEPVENSSSNREPLYVITNWQTLLHAGEAR